MTQATRLTDLPPDQLTDAERQRLTASDRADAHWSDLIAQQEQRRLERAHAGLLVVAVVLAGLSIVALLYA